MKKLFTVLAVFSVFVLSVDHFHPTSCNWSEGKFVPFQTCFVSSTQTAISAGNDARSLSST